MAEPPRWLAALLLIGLAAAFGWFLKGDLADYRRFRHLQDSASRRRRFWVWTAKLWLGFALPSVIGLAVLGRLGALVALPAEFAVLPSWLPRDHDVGGLMAGGLIGATIGGVVIGGVVGWRRRRGKHGGDLRLGEFRSLLPREPGELLPVAAMAISAGIAEEVAFRLFLPLLLAILTGNVALAFAVAAAVFGAMHLYQGWKGVVATGVVGLFMAAVYLGSGTLWLPVVLHAAIDLVGLVVRPLMEGRVRRAALSS